MAFDPKGILNPVACTRSSDGYQITDDLRATHAGRVAEEILRKCVHCGFCTATCPTYQMLGR
jgi:heterodisulfide reductase subunit C